MFGLSTELELIGHRKEVRVLTFRALALCQSNPCSLRRANVGGVSSQISLRWPIDLYLLTPLIIKQTFILIFTL